MASSFLGDQAEFEDISPRMRVVSELATSDNGPFRILIGERLGKKFILKTLKDKYKADPIYSLMLRKEFEIGFSLSHPGIARTLSLEEVEKLGPTIIEEFVAGKTLQQLIQSGNLDGDKAADIIRELISTLSYIHDNQIVHNDIKPSNIIISDFDGKPKIIDFGFADSPNYTSLKFRGGTSEYIAPERLNGDNAGDPRNDIWSLGVVAKRLAPHAGKNRNRLLKLADRCALPLTVRTRDAKDLLPILINRKGKLWLPFLFILISVLAAMVYFWVGLQSNRQLETEVNPSETPNVEVQTEAAIPPKELPEISQESPVENTSTSDVSVQTVKEPKESPVTSHARKLRQEYDTAETEIYNLLAINYATRLTEEMIAKRKAEGKFHQPETREQLLESRYEYDRLMQSISNYVETLGIPSETLQSEVVRMAQKAATDLIHQEAAKRDGKILEPQ